MEGRGTWEWEGWVAGWLGGWLVYTWVGYTFLAWQTHLCHHEVHDEDVDVGAVSPGQQEEEEHPYLGGWRKKEAL